MKIRLYNSSQLNLFPIYLTTVATKRLQEKIVRPNGFNSHQLFVVSSGKGIIKINNETYDLSTNDFFYIEKDFPHEYYGKDDNFSTTFISFMGGGFEGIKQHYNLHKYGIYTDKNKGTFVTQVKNLYTNIEKQELPVLCSDTFSTIISFFEEACKKEYDEIEIVHKFLLENYSTSLTLDDILTFYPYSKSKLCRSFKDKYGSTIFDFLTVTRLTHAKSLITNHPNLKLDEIAHNCGFNDVSYFCKMYKRYFNSAPKSKINIK